MFERHNAKALSLIEDLADPRLSLQRTNDIAVLHINTALCSAQISLQGAQLLKFCPHDGRDWLHPPNTSECITGQAIDAGIPLCLPWFGRHANSDYPIHGYLRNACWQLSTLRMEGDECIAAFTYHHQPTKLFDYHFTAEHILRLGRDIQLQLTIENHNDVDMPLSFAWHSYFQVANSANVQLHGLDQHVFLDNLIGLKKRLQQGLLQFGPAVDAVFEGTKNPQILDTGQCVLHISGDNCPTAIIWNPGPNTSHFVCAERGRAFADAITLAAKQRFSARLIIKE